MSDDCPTAPCRYCGRTTPTLGFDWCDDCEIMPNSKLLDLVQRRAVAAESALAEVTEREKELRQVLLSMAQYDERWPGRRSNTMPSRARLIGMAYDATSNPGGDEKP